jgi:hypothetical protein
MHEEPPPNMGETLINAAYETAWSGEAPSIIPEVDQSPQPKREKKLTIPLSKAPLSGHLAGSLSGGFDIDMMNKQWAVIGATKAVQILEERDDLRPEDRIQFLTVQAFMQRYANQFTKVVAANGKEIWKTHSEAWFTNLERREYSGISFYPLSYGEKPPLSERKYFNLWRGFSYAPSEKGTCEIFKDHILNNVCAGNEDHFNWVFGWFAQLMQQPRSKPGTSLVLRGGMGTGKTIVGEVVGKLVENHFMRASHSRYVTGNFNSHMASCLLLLAEEAVWAGGKEDAGKLKDLITSSHNTIEKKGVDSTVVDNFMRVMMTSNERWVVPAGHDERRFAVFDIGEGSKQNHLYFKEMFAELNAGGYERLLHEMLNFDLTKVDIAVIPKTEALIEQKLETGDFLHQWWFQKLDDGMLFQVDGLWPETVESRKLYEDYVKEANIVGIKRLLPERPFWCELRPLLGVCAHFEPKKRMTDAQGRRYWGYELNGVHVHRELFEARYGQAMKWQSLKSYGEARDQL